MKLVSKTFYLDNDVVNIAKTLLGKVLISSIGAHPISCRIVETEAYRGPDDRACHAYNYRQTERTKVIYEEGGVAYIYISYGMHFMLNVVTSTKGNAHAILIRAVEPLEGIESMVVNRKIQADNYLLTGGPGKVCQALGITKEINGLAFYKKDSPLQIYDDGHFIENKNIITTSRVGMSIHTAEASNWPWRFYIKGNKYVSRPLKVFYPW